MINRLSGGVKKLTGNPVQQGPGDTLAHTLWTPPTVTEGKSITGEGDAPQIKASIGVMETSGSFGTFSQRNHRLESHTGKTTAATMSDNESCSAPHGGSALTSVAEDRRAKIVA